MRRAVPIFVPVLALALAVGLGFALGPTARADEPTTITVVTHDSFALSKRVLRSFERTSGIEVRILRSGDAGEAVNSAILTKDHPLGDVLFGVDTTFLSRALDAGIFETYRPAALDALEPGLAAGTRGKATPVDRGDVCVNVDNEWFAERDLAVPKSIDDLTDPAYRGLLVVENPATSSPGLAFLLSTIARNGDGWPEYWQRLRDNDVEVVNGWEAAYNGSFSAGGGGGDRPLVVSYASSPAAAVFYSEPDPSGAVPEQAPVGTILDGCFRQVEYVGVLRDTEHPGAARRFVDFMLSRRVQEDIPLQMFVFPARADARLPDVFRDFAEIPPAPEAVAPRRIERNRERWIDEWTDVVLR
ncbi:MAG: thiamine ABC transporter substrate-binding protein [Acidimicrobiia bacterium]